MDCRDLATDILDGLSAAIVVTEVGSLRVTAVNTGAGVLFGRTVAEMVDHPREALRLRREENPDEPIPFPPAGLPVRDAQVLIARPDGSLIPVSWSVIPLDTGGRPVLVEVFFDIAERRVRQRGKNIARRLAAIGSLASGIAHEINTPVQYIGDSLTFLKDAGADVARLFDLYLELERLAPATDEIETLRRRIRQAAQDMELDFLRDEMPRAVDRALEGVARITDIVLAMKRFAHPGGEEKRPVDVNKAVQDTITVARNEWKYAARLDLDLDPALPLVMAHAGDVGQVLLNLVVNAAHAVAQVVGDTGKKGVIRVRTWVAGDRVGISVSDTGPGIPLALQESIFDPFFTTKDVGKGTGQGLALVHDIVVDRHGGDVRVDSKPGHGATFIVELPVSDVHDSGRTPGEP